MRRGWVNDLPQCGHLLASVASEDICGDEGTTGVCVVEGPCHCGVSEVCCCVWRWGGVTVSGDDCGGGVAYVCEGFSTLYVTAGAFLVVFGIGAILMGCFTALRKPRSENAMPTTVVMMVMIKRACTTLSSNQY